VWRDNVYLFCLINAEVVGKSYQELYVLGVRFFWYIYTTGIEVLVYLNLFGFYPTGGTNVLGKLYLLFRLLLGRKTLTASLQLASMVPVQVRNDVFRLILLFSRTLMHYYQCYYYYYLFVIYLEKIQFPEIVAVYSRCIFVVSSLSITRIVKGSSYSFVKSSSENYYCVLGNSNNC